MLSRRALHDHLHAAVRAARAVGPLLLRWAGRPTRVTTKRSAIDLVTEIDRRAEERIRGILSRATPRVGFFGEETHTAAPPAACCWYVDPIDGTTNFVHGVPIFCISIGLIVNGVSHLGVIYDPMREELFTAITGQGSFLNGRRIRVSRTQRLADSLFATGFPTEFRQAPRKFLRPFAALQQTTHAVRRMGSAALNLAYVACGRLDGVWEERIWPWDIAAALVLLQEAGARATTFRNRPSRVSDDHVLATNGRVHRPALRAMRGALRHAPATR